MNAIIRRMKIEDLKQVIEIDHSSFSLPWPERSFRFEIAENPAAHCWVTEQDGAVVCFLVFWLIIDEAHIATLATRADQRRNGLGTALMSHALKEAASQGAQSAYLEVRAGNLIAQEMYLKMGFVESDRRSRYYKDNGEDAILMTLKRLQSVSEYRLRNGEKP
ncbi:MAG: ribosomal-protein-alanine N-acetyltransferase [Chloroflexi bacterium RBG_16_51_16]|nr:MAG: ribosomal-protein-alanine N-acetyltransferase [Chloroflexi bacterium RBG_16_51_16]